MLIKAARRDETLAEDLFRRGGFESYLPQTKSRKGGKTRIAPLFPGYIFVRIIDQWYPVRWTIGVLRILMAGDEPARLADQVVDSIRRREVGGFVKLPSAIKRGPLNPGQKVRILTGSFQGHVGLYDGQSPQERERVLLNLLGRRVPVVLAKDDRLAAL